MTQEQALAEFQAMFPEDAEKLSVSRERFIGYKPRNTFYLWNRTGLGPDIIASSERSFEHALAIAKSGNEDCWPEDDSPIEDAA